MKFRIISRDIRQRYNALVKANTPKKEIGNLEILFTKIEDDN